MTTVNIHDAKTHFSQLINAVLRGENVIIARAGKPVIKLVAYSETLPPRHGGQLKGMLKISDDFDAPLPDDVISQFYHGSDE